MKIEFNGPYSWSNENGIASVFDNPFSKKQGIYLWTVPQKEGELVYYIGETGRSFSIRMLEHLKEHLAGFYHLYDPIKMQNGIKDSVWPGYYDKNNRKAITDIINNSVGNTAVAYELTKVYKFYLAPTEIEDRLRRRIEAAIAIHLYNQPGIIGSFQDDGIRYAPRKEREEPVQVTIEAPNMICGLPNEINA